MKEKMFKVGIRKRLLSVALALVMVCSLMPMNSLTVEAANSCRYYKCPHCDYIASDYDYIHHYCYGNTTCLICYGAPSKTNHPEGRCDGTADWHSDHAVIVSSIAMKTLPTKTTYEIGETLDLTGAQITATKSDSSTEDIAVTLSMVSGFDSSTAGSKTVTVTYESKTTTFTVTVNPHAHNFTYTASNATLTATCGANGCGLTDKKVSLTLSADSATYFGGAQGITEIIGLSDFNIITGKTIALTEVKYWTNAAHTIATTQANSGASDTNKAPVNVGTYYATLEVEGQTAIVSYTIDKADPAYTVPTGLEATYGDTLADVLLPQVGNGTWTWKAATTTSVGNVGTNVFAAVLTPNDETNYNVKEENVSVHVVQSNVIAGAPGTTKNEQVKSGKKVSDIELPSGWTWSDDCKDIVLPTIVGDTQMATAIYTADDAANYTDAAKTVAITITMSACAHPTDKVDEVIDLKPTCTVDGKKHKFCNECGVVIEDNIPIAKTGHTPSEAVKENIVAPTCTTKGSYDSVIYCSVCKEKISTTPMTVDALGHKYGDWTCVDAHVHQRVCERDSTHIEKEEHIFKDGKCTICGYTVEYKIKAGENATWIAGSKEGLNIVSEADFAKFIGVRVDGEMVDSANYTAVSGSTDVTVKPSYLSTLSVGAHTLEILSTDGSAKTTFTIKKGADVEPKPDTPATGDPFNTSIWILLGLSILGFIGLVLKRRKVS